MRESRGNFFKSSLWRVPRVPRVPRASPTNPNLKTDLLGHIGNVLLRRAFSAAASDGTHHALMISNLSGTTQELNIEGVDLSKAKYHVIDQERLLSWSPAVSAIENNMVLLIEW